MKYRLWRPWSLPGPARANEPIIYSPISAVAADSYLDSSAEPTRMSAAVSGGYSVFHIYCRTEIIIL
jgi:tellurite resistance protein TehA-like permease